MANRYIIHGATYNGDGTTSAEATSNGGVGAWNTITYFEGATPAYGTLPAGTTVYIRSKDAGNATMNISRSATVNFGSSAATEGSPISWVIDGGTIWSGVSGVVTFNNTTSRYQYEMYNNIRAEVKDSLVLKTSFSSLAGGVFYLGNGTLENVKLDFSSITGGWQWIKPHDGQWRTCYFNNVTIIIGASGFGNGYIALDYTNSNSLFELTNCDIQLPVNLAGQGVFGNINASYGIVRVIGGSVSGVGANSGDMTLVGYGTSGALDFIGLVYPPTLAFGSIQFKPVASTGFGADGGFSGSYAAVWGYADSRSNGNHPTLTAYATTSESTPLSWKVYQKYTSLAYIASVVSTKMYVDTAAVKQVTLQINLSTSITNFLAERTWIDVSYIDNATGLPKSATSRLYDGSAIPDSSAVWSLPTYGPIGLAPKKLSITTPTAVKKDTVITVVYKSSVGAVSANDIVFICPDFEVI